MSSFFEAYDAVRASGLLDADFYRATYPDVAESNADPVIHYLETGAAEGRLPSAAFDVDFYLEQCARLGEHPSNPLLHFIMSGAARGFRTRREAVPEKAAAIPVKWSRKAGGVRMFIDSPRISDGAAVVPVRGSLDLNGWAFSPDGVASVDVSVDGVRFAAARTGVKRVDVQQAFPDWPEALYSGFTLLIPHRALPRGVRTVTVTVVDRCDRAYATSFQLRVVDSLEGKGPWTLRRKMSAAESNLYHAVLAGLSWQPEFRLVVFVDGAKGAGDRLRLTLQTLGDQAYAYWQAIVIAGSPGLLGQGLRDVLAAFPDISGRITLVAESAGRRFSEFARVGGASPAAEEPAPERSSWLGVLQAGDQLGCNALLRLAIAAVSRSGRRPPLQRRTLLECHGPSR